MQYKGYGWKKKIQSCNCPERQAGCEGKKKYILQQFKIPGVCRGFSQRLKAVLALDTLPTRYNTIGFRYRGYDIYMKYTACFLTPLELLERKIKIRDTSNQYADVSY